MSSIWDAEARFRIWFEIEAHALDAMAELGVVPKEAAAAVWERGTFEVERIDAIEAEVRHDVIAFLTNVAEHVGPEARFLHQGMTSSDVLDTCLAVQLKRSADLLIEDVDALLEVLKRRAFEHKLTRRSAGATESTPSRSPSASSSPSLTPSSPGRGSGWSGPARKSRPCAISGAVGTFANIDPRWKPMLPRRWA
jgi:adenylosuccinate lyase